MNANVVDSLVTQLAEMDRSRLVAFLRSLHCSFPIDFTDDYLNSVSIDRLRHIALAACLHPEAA